MHQGTFLPPHHTAPRHSSALCLYVRASLSLSLSGPSPAVLSIAITSHDPPHPYMPTASLHALQPRMTARPSLHQTVSTVYVKQKEWESSHHQQKNNSNSNCSTVNIYSQYFRQNESCGKCAKSRKCGLCQSNGMSDLPPLQ